MQVLSDRGDIDLERELNNVYLMFLEGQASLVKLKGIMILHSPSYTLPPSPLPPSPLPPYML